MCATEKIVLFVAEDRFGSLILVYPAWVQSWWTVKTAPVGGDVPFPGYWQDSQDIAVVADLLGISPTRGSWPPRVEVGRDVALAILGYDMAERVELDQVPQEWRWAGLLANVLKDGPLRRMAQRLVESGDEDAMLTCYEDDASDWAITITMIHDED